MLKLLTALLFPAPTPSWSQLRGGNARDALTIMLNRGRGARAH